jgi:hypothetical protein
MTMNRTLTRLTSAHRVPRFGLPATGDPPAARRPAGDPLPALRRVLLANGVCCTVAGLAAVALAGRLGGPTGIAPPLLVIAGGATAAFGLFLLAVTAPGTGPFLLEWSGWTTFFVDAIWVAGSLAVLLNGRLPLTPAGRALVFALGAAVALFASLEWRALRRRR